jgi:hypothetical protein
VRKDRQSVRSVQLIVTAEEAGDVMTVEEVTGDRDETEEAVEVTDAEATGVREEITDKILQCRG